MKYRKKKRGKYCIDNDVRTLPPIPPICKQFLRENIIESCMETVEVQGTGLVSSKLEANCKWHPQQQIQIKVHRTVRDGLFLPDHSEKLT